MATCRQIRAAFSGPRKTGRIPYFDGGKPPAESAAKSALSKADCVRRLRAPLERFLKIIGSSVKRLPRVMRASHPTVPRKEIASRAIVLSHGDDDVNYQVLWDAVQNDLRVLPVTVERVLKESSCILSSLVPLPPLALTADGFSA